MMTQLNDTYKQQLPDEFNMMKPWNEDTSHITGPLITSRFPVQSVYMVLFVGSLDKILSKRSGGWWLELTHI